MTNIIDAFKQTMSNAGIEPPGDIIADGEMHRFRCSCKPGKNENGRYILHLDPPANGQVMCHRCHQEWMRWSAKEYKSYTPEEKAAYKANMEAAKAAREADRKHVQAECREWCKKTWSTAKDATNDHPYLKRKGVNAYGLKTRKDMLLVPVFSRWHTNDIIGMQFISPDGTKKFKTGTGKTGNSFQIGQRTDDDIVIVCEGYATGASIYQATGKCVMIAFDAGNLLSVAQMVRSWGANIKIILATDNDHVTEGNPGLTKATEAARAVNGLLAVPTGNGTDFNDMHQEQGLDAVKTCIMAAAEPIPEATPAGESGSQGGRADTHVQLIQANTIEPENIVWVWKDWLPGGKLVVFAGQPGTGKTTVMLAVTTVTTIGGRLPDGSTANTGSVVIWSGEDGVADTLVPRLIAMGADMSKVFFVSGTGRVHFDPAKDMPQLSRQIKMIPDVKLVIIDPVVSVINGDSHKNAEVRKGLQPLVDLGADTGACIVGISHFNKSGNNANPLDLISGSIAFAAVARVVLGAAKLTAPDEDHGHSRIFCRVKSNIGPDEDGIGYDLRMEPVPGHPEIEASTVLWGQCVTGHSRVLLAQAAGEAGNPKANTRESKAVDFLRDILENGSVSQKTIEDQAEQAGIAEKTLRRAKKTLSVVSKKTFSGWTWELPSADINERIFGKRDSELQGGQIQDGQIIITKKHDHLGHLDHLETKNDSNMAKMVNMAMISEDKIWPSCRGQLEIEDAEFTAHDETEIQTYDDSFFEEELPL